MGYIQATTGESEGGMSPLTTNFAPPPFEESKNKIEEKTQAYKEKIGGRIREIFGKKTDFTGIRLPKSGKGI